MGMRAGELRACVRAHVRVCNIYTGLCGIKHYLDDPGVDNNCDRFSTSVNLVVYDMIQDTE